MDRIGNNPNNYAGEIGGNNTHSATSLTGLSAVSNVSNQPGIPCDWIEPESLSMTPNAIDPALTGKPGLPLEYSNLYSVDENNIVEFAKKLRGYKQPFTYPHEFKKINISTLLNSLFPHPVTSDNTAEPVMIKNQQFYDCVLPGKGSYGKNVKIEECLFSAKKEPLHWENVELSKITQSFSKNIFRGGGRDGDPLSWGKAYRIDFSRVDMTYSDISNMKFYYEPNTIMENVNLSYSTFSNVMFASLYVPFEYFLLDADFSHLSAENVYFEGVKYSGSLVGAKIKNFSMDGYVDLNGADFGDSYQNGDIRLHPRMVGSLDYIDYNLINKKTRPGNLYLILDSLSSEKVRVDWAEQLVGMCNSIQLLQKIFAESVTLRQSILDELGKGCYQGSAMINDFVDHVQKKFGQRKAL